jgi:RNA polymerase sigma factor for flagellar operon FliA
MTRAADAPSIARGELDLWHAWKAEGQLAAREALFALHADFARRLAQRHLRGRGLGGVDLGDLRQLAYAGLLEAIDRYDPTLNVPFRGYAAHRIRGSIKDGLAHASELHEQLGWRRRMHRERVRSMADDTEAFDTAEALRLLRDLAVGLALGFMLEDAGLAASPEASSGATTLWQSAAWREVTIRLRSELDALPAREQTILRLHYLDEVGFDQLSELMRLSKGRISQIHRAALGTLRKRMAARGHFRFEE